MKNIYIAALACALFGCGGGGGGKSVSTNTTQHDDFRVQIVKPSLYQLATLNVGSEVYVDNPDFVVQSLPVELDAAGVTNRFEGMRFIKTSTADIMSRTSVGESHLAFTVNRVANVLVAIDVRVPKVLPAWLGGWTKTNRQIKVMQKSLGVTSVVSLELYQKSFGEGSNVTTVDLGGNESLGTGLMYFVLIPRESVREFSTAGLIANPDGPFEISPGQVADLNVISNDSGEAREILIAEQPRLGKIEILANHKIRYKAPATTTAINDSFVYQLRASDGTSASALVKIYFPCDGCDRSVQVVAVPDLVEKREGEILQVDILGNDLGVITKVQMVENGKTVSGQIVSGADGRQKLELRTMADVPDWSVAQDRLSYKVSHVDAAGQILAESLGDVQVKVTATTPAVTVKAQNDVYQVAAGQSLTLNVLSNDTISGGEIVLSLPAGGSTIGKISIGAGTLLYAAPPGIDAVDQFSYKVESRDMYGNVLAASTAVVQVTVTCSGCAGRAPAPPSAGTSPDLVVNPDNAAMDPYMTRQTSITVDVTANDLGAPDTVVLVDSPVNGRVSVSGLVMVYQPNQYFVGTEEFSYVIRKTMPDGKVYQSANIGKVRILVDCGGSCDDKMPTVINLSWIDPASYTDGEALLPSDIKHYRVYGGLVESAPDLLQIKQFNQTSTFLDGLTGQRMISLSMSELMGQFSGITNQICFAVSVTAAPTGSRCKTGACNPAESGYSSVKCKRW